MSRNAEEVLNALAAKVKRHGIRATFGNSVHEFLGNATPENAPRTCQRAVVVIEGVPYMVEILSRSKEATYGAMPLRCFKEGRSLRTLSVRHRYFPTPVVLDSDKVFLERLIGEGKWTSRRTNVDTLGRITEASAR